MEVKVPDIGDFTDVPVIEVLVSAGDEVAEEDPLITLESDKATMDVPAPAAGKISELKVSVGDKVSEGTVIVVLGAGPGGYSAAFRAADLGLKVALVDDGERLGGVCLNVGCIPSKALLHVAKVLAEADELGAAGVKFAKPDIDVDAVRAWKESVVGRLTGGLDGLAKQRKVQVVR